MGRSWDPGLCTRCTRPFALLVMILLTGCQSGAYSPSKATSDGWRVVERTGEARWSAPAASASSGKPWATLAAGDRVAGPATVITGPASRVILARDGHRVRLGPSSQVELLATAQPYLLTQEAGAAEYRIAGDADRPIRIRTPHGVAESASGVFWIETGADPARSAFAVEEGALSVSHAEVERGITIRAGQYAEAGSAHGPKLAFARAAGAPLEPVGPAATPQVAQPLPVTSPGEPLPVVATAPERHPSARSSALARAPAPALMRTADAAGEDAASAEPTKPDERIILPATFQAGRTERGAAASADALPDDHEVVPATLETGEREHASPDDMRTLTGGLLEGLGRAPAPAGR